jgi:Na+/proline symporter
MGIELSATSWKVLIAFGCYLVGVAALGVFAHRYLSRGSFVKEYFLGNRGLGPWVLALTVAATAISGGTFMGFPSLIYTNGWIMALWICSYMVVPLMTMALLGKRINQVARVSGAVTLPDVLRDRFQSPTLGIVASLLILLFLMFNLVAQFKAGGLVMKEALGLRPASAEFLGASVDKDKNLVLSFRLADGGTDTQKTPLPREDSNPTITSVDPDQRQVAVEFQAPGQEEPTRKKIPFPPPKVRVPFSDAPVELGYLLGLFLFALTVVAYTTYGGFWAVTWTDVLEGLVMLAGVILMAILAMRAVPEAKVERTDPASGQVVEVQLHGLEAATEHLRQQNPALVYGPGPKDYLPLGMAFSFFLMWSLIGAGQPSGMVRLMSFKDSASLRRALLLVSGYYLLTYLSLLIIFVCARAIYPTQYLREVGSEGVPDSIMPAMALHLTRDYPEVGGLLLAAPYAAIMSTVAAFLLMISSSLVRDLYQRVINPNVSSRTIKVASYLVTGLVGLGVVIRALDPPGYLQYIIVFTGTGQGCTFLVPMAMSLYWRRATRAGVLAGMLGGFLTVFALYVAGWIDSSNQKVVKAYEQQKQAAAAQGQPEPEPPAAVSVQKSMRWIPGWGQERPDAFAPLYLGGVDTLVWGFLASLVLGVGVSLATRPDEELVRRYFPSS